MGVTGDKGAGEAEAPSVDQTRQENRAVLLTWLEQAGVPGAVVAWVSAGRTECCAAGVRSAWRGGAVDGRTLFEAASLSKPVFAMAVLLLADDGRFDLDAPLGAMVPGYAADAGMAALTAADVLCHGGGLPNWRGQEWPLRTCFTRRARFSYSGEGYLFLQRAVEAVTGEAAAGLMDRLVLRPLGMERSSFVWRGDADGNWAEPHDAYGRPALAYRPGAMNAAWSLQSCAEDYGRFLMGVLGGAMLRPETARLWLRPHVAVRHRGAQALGAEVEEVETGCAWGLGWGLETGGGSFWHWGDNGGFTAFALGSVERGEAVLGLFNGASGLAVAPEMVRRCMPGERASLVWLERGGLEAPMRAVLRGALARGVEAVWDDVEALGEDERGWVARGLRAHGRDEQWARVQEACV